MVQAKSELFEKELIEQAAFFKALAHPARLKVLEILVDSSNCITADISEELPLGRTTVNQHLNELKTMGLIKGHIEGKTMKYCIDPVKIERLKKMIGQFSSKLNVNNYQCK